MRITTWNCNMAFRKKAHVILKHKPHVLIVPECEHPERQLFPLATQLPNDVMWMGNNPTKGLGIFSYGGYKFSLLDCYNPQLKTIVPIAVTGGEIDFTLLAIWANHPADRGFEYVGQIWKALHQYEHLLNGPVILAGDFNSNTIFDKPKREGNHSTLVTKLQQKKIYSCYHQYYKQQQGTEKHATWYLYRHQDKPYHLDYCFASHHFQIKKVTVGRYANWRLYSDHMPLTVTFAVG